MPASDRHLAALKRLHGDLDLYSRECLKVKNKAGELVPLIFNRSQKFLHARLQDQKKRTGMVRAILGKGRQFGGSTYIGGRFYHSTSLNPGVDTFILTHSQDATDNLFGMVQRFYEHSPLRPSIGASNAKEMNFDKLDSGYAVGTAGSVEVGRSKTIRRLHGCLSPATLIVDGSTDQLRPMGSFQQGDLVRTHVGNIAPVSFVSSQYKPAQRLSVKGATAFPLLATDEHRFWTKSGWREVSQLSAGDLLGFPVVELIETEIPWRFRLADTPRPQGGGTRETGPDTVLPGYEIGRILGLYLAEGCLIKQHKTGVLSAVSFAVHEREVKRTLEWLKPLAHLFRKPPAVGVRESKTRTVTVYGRSFATFVKDRCGELDNKRLPAEWRVSGEGFARGLVHGYLAGDGHSSKRVGDRRISAPSIRAAITVGIRDALASLGYGWASIAHQVAAVRHGRNEREQWILRITGVGVDRMCEELGWKMPPRRRHGYKQIEVSQGYAWCPIVSMEDAGEIEVMDFEIDHEDHSYCTVHAATHNSECAFWKNAAAHFAGVVQTVPRLPGTEVILESTGHGIGGEFHARWQQAEAGVGDYEAIFVPWFWSDEYRQDVKPDFELDEEEQYYAGIHHLDLQQMAWRRAKIAELRDPLLFKQEYPATATEMFEYTGHDSFISAESVIAARKNTCEPIGPLVVGVDPSRFGDDRFSVAWRRGRKLIKVESRSKIGTSEAVGWLKQIIDRDRPARMFMDVGGGGDRIFDILESYGSPYDKVVKLVAFGGAPQEPVEYLKDGTKRAGPKNRRAEIWTRWRDWLEQEGGADMPDSDSLQADACGPGYHYDLTTQQLILESKEHMRDVRKIRSPDEGDAVALTFAEPVKELREEKPAAAVRTVQGGAQGHEWLGN